jgi:hypothetical protein
MLRTPLCTAVRPLVACGLNDPSSLAVDSAGSLLGTLGTLGISGAAGLHYQAWDYVS